MFSSKQYAALEEVNVSILPEQLAVLRNQVEAENPSPLAQSQFNYAWGLIKSANRTDRKKGIEIFAGLYRDEPSMRREALYYLALGSYKEGEYSNARRYAQTLREKEPHNEQLKALLQAIEDKITQDGLIGIGIAGGVLAVGMGIIGALVRKKR